MSDFSFSKYLSAGQTVKRGGGFGRWLRVSIGRFRPNTEMFDGPRMTPEYMNDLKGTGRSLDTRDLGMNAKRTLR
jgi:hypothetical protein